MRRSHAPVLYVILAFPNATAADSVYLVVFQTKDSGQVDDVTRSSIHSVSLLCSCSRSSHLSISVYRLLEPQRKRRTGSFSRPRVMTDLLTGVQIITNWWTEGRMGKTNRRTRDLCGRRTCRRGPPRMASRRPHTTSTCAAASDRGNWSSIKRARAVSGGAWLGRY